MNFIQTYQERVNHHLERLLPDRTEEPTRLHEAMYYAVMSGGKRIRPLLTYATGLCFGGDPRKMDNAAAAVEFIHCYSLVHDDLPAMDDDDFRRGKPSCHKAFDEATAILTGDALQSLAFEMLARENKPRLIATLAHACGSLGMAGGQQLDLEAKNKALSQKQIEKIHHLKTAALFSAAIELGALSADCVDEKILKKLRELGTLIGLIFQWKDDLDDQTIKDQKTQSIIVDNINHLFKKTKQLLNQLEGNTTFLNLMIDLLQSSKAINFPLPL